MNANMVQKQKPEIGHEIVKIGGPVYRIGVGGGSASSIQVQGDNKEELDFNAVQRGTFTHVLFLLVKSSTLCDFVQVMPRWKIN